MLMINSTSSQKKLLSIVVTYFNCHQLISCCLATISSFPNSKPCARITEDIITIIIIVIIIIIIVISCITSCSQFLLPPLLQSISLPFATRSTFPPIIFRKEQSFQEYQLNSVLKVTIRLGTYPISRLEKATLQKEKVPKKAEESDTTSIPTIQSPTRIQS